MEHRHHDHDCRHERIRYCFTCRKPYCADCLREWEDPCQRSHYDPFIWQYSTKTYPATTSYPSQPHYAVTTTCSHDEVR